MYFKFKNYLNFKIVFWLAFIDLRLTLESGPDCLVHYPQSSSFQGQSFISQFGVKMWQWMLHA